MADDWRQPERRRRYEANVQRARDLRPVARKNPDGSPSTVLFSSYGTHVAPTLFPKEGATSDPKDWIQLYGMDAYNEAKKRGELFEFDTEVEARFFARGDWKPPEGRPEYRALGDTPSQFEIDNQSERFPLTLPGQRLPPTHYEIENPEWLIGRQSQQAPPKQPDMPKPNMTERAQRRQRAAEAVIKKHGNGE